jgi:hypothetical protein
LKGAKKHKTNKEGFVQNIEKDHENTLDLPQPWKCIYMANILIQSVLEKGKG